MDQDKHFAQTPHVDIGSNAPSLREAWPRMEDSIPERRSSDRASLSPLVKKKKRGLGRLWKVITGGPNKTHVLQGGNDPPREEEYEDLPLAPPPPLSYLVNRHSSQSDRSINMMGQGRHVSMPSLTLSNGPHHPRSNSTPSGFAVGLSSPSEKSSTLPSPTEVRFPYRDSSGDERDDGAYEEDAGLSIKKNGLLGVGPPRPLVVNISEPDFLVNPMLTPPLSQTTGTGHSSSSLAPTIKVPAVPPVSRMGALSLDKSLPPLPSGEQELSTPISLLHRPQRSAVPSATLPMASYKHRPERELSAPNSGFLSEDTARRQSSDGLGCRPGLPRGAGQGITPGMRYDDFGTSRHSLAVFEPAPSLTSQRKSRFGFGTLLGRKEKSSRGHRQHASVTTTPALRTREASFDAFSPHISLSERSLSQQGMGPLSRRPLDDLVPQDPDFVAYRYPSKDERLDLSRN